MDPQLSLTTRPTSLQLGTIGTEIGRAISWRANPAYGDPAACINRALNYIVQILDDDNLAPGKRRELARLKEVLLDWYFGENLYQTKDNDWDKYFIPFSLAANRK